jgi:hypothetical protein
VEKAALRAGLGKVTPQDLRRSFCSLAGRRGVDPVEAAQITGHSPAVWARFYARSFGKAQRDEARDRLLRYGFEAVSDEEAHGPLAPGRFLKVGGTRHCANQPAIVVAAPLSVA